MKKTKIVCSIGPASRSVDTLVEMANGGMNVVRINFSHASLDEMIEEVDMIKKTREITGKNIGIMYDTKGPDFRCGDIVSEGINLQVGEIVRIVKDDIVGSGNTFTVNYKLALDNFKVGNVLLLEDGLMKLEVVSCEEDGITCKVIDGGVLRSRKGINVPGVNLNIPFMSEQDLIDIIYACENEGDFLSLSFVDGREHIEQVRKILKDHNREDMQIISKIECKAAVDNIDDIIKASDGIMVARGDLGVEVAFHELPMLQKIIIRKCREYGKYVIVATEMLQSMCTNSRPSRAEVLDISNAVIDGADAVMLSSETAVGKYPVDAVSYMADICEYTEKSVDFYNVFRYQDELDTTHAIAKAVIESARLTNAKLIVAATMSGYTARRISNLKPRTNILAKCPSEKVARSLALNWGVDIVVTSIQNSTDEVINDSVEKAKEFMQLVPGDNIIVTGGFPISTSKTTNLMKIEKIQ